MKIRLLLLLLLTAFLAGPLLRAQDLDGSDLNKEVLAREERVNKLPYDEQARLGTAQAKALQDPAVQDALRKRNEAMNQFQDAVQAAMLKADPSITPILQKVARMSQAQRAPRRRR
ncbi:MAG TPA: hypothetical protein VHW03_07035 [Chthoniobacterales bacterium]|jgi:hypothetical protein|nr:hypothetical protein [Chthoniobacterales bacterium]